MASPACTLDNPSLIETEGSHVEFRDDRRNVEELGKHDQFRWASLYENQRGFTFFSVPYYSSRSLLPNDPPPFTLPDPGESTPSFNGRPHYGPPNVTPSTYPLPDPTWRWLSKTWLVDMQADGDVQHDGFQYNWYFRHNHWRSHVGWLSAGGYVRRRRWIRLMMRPSDARVHAEAAFEEDDVNVPKNQQWQGTRVWRGNPHDWDRLRRALKNLPGDESKLALWEDWLANMVNDDSPPSRYIKETEDISNDPIQEDERLKMPECPSREWILALLREHGRALGGLFIFPDSRARLRDMLFKAGLLLDPTEIEELIGPEEFWSRKSAPLDSIESTRIKEKGKAS